LKIQKKRYKVFQIPKNNGKYRTVYSVDQEVKDRLRLILPLLQKIKDNLDATNINYAFENGRNCVMGASQHQGNNYSLSMDLVNFFDSVNREHVRDLISGNILENCLIDDSPRQGLPTSPLIATIAFLKFDYLIVKALKRLSENVVYTRYADDLTFSFNDPTNNKLIQKIVEEILQDSGFALNRKKTKFQNKSNGRIVINGVSLGNGKVRPTRKTLKKIRAARHQNNKDSLRGLLEWAKCKEPKAGA